MHEDNLNSQDESIRRLLAEAVAPQSLMDADIEAMLTSADTATPLSDELRHRLVGKVQRLIETADDADRTVTSTALPVVVVSQSTHHASQPRLVLVSTTDVPLRGNRKAAIASLLASLLALVSVVVLTSNVPVPRAISQHDQRNTSSGTLLTDLQRRQALQRGVHYQMTAMAKPEIPPVVKVAVGDEISTGEFERRRVSLPDGSVLYVNSNAQVKIVSERRVEVAKGEVFVEVVPTLEPNGQSSKLILRNYHIDVHIEDGAVCSQAGNSVQSQRISADVNGRLSESAGLDSSADSSGQTSSEALQGFPVA
jgi:hypothetical protein